jgi:hypothetical protein
MGMRLVLVLAIALAAGVAAGSMWDRLTGVGVFAATAVVGAMVLVLRRNQRDLQEMEAGLPPGQVGDAISERPPLEPHHPSRD